MTSIIDFYYLCVHIYLHLQIRACYGQTKKKNYIKRLNVITKKIENSSLRHFEGLGPGPPQGKGPEALPSVPHPLDGPDGENTTFKY